MFKVMIVDDEYDIREGLTTLTDWEKQGFTVAVTARDGIEALEIYEKEKVSLVITDIKMPGMDGLELSGRLKELNNEVEIIIISGYNDFNYARQALKYNVSSYLLKPIMLDELHSELEAVKKRLMKRMGERRTAIEYRERLKDYFLIRAARGEIVKDADKSAREFGISLSGKRALILAVQLENLAGTSGSTDIGDMAPGRLVVKNILEELLEEGKKGFLFEDIEYHFGILYLSSEEDAARLQDEVRCFVHNAEEKVKRFASDSKIAVGIGCIAGDWDSLKDSYRSAADSLSRARYNKLDRRISDILNYIETNYQEDLSLKKLSSVFFINSIYLGQLFKKETGENFHNCINRVRIENAKRLLRDEKLSIHEVSERVGYKNLEHFYLSFKNIEGCSPGEYLRSLSR